MLRVPTFSGSLLRVLEAFRKRFTTPTFATFVTLLAGMIGRPAHRTVCGMLAGAGVAGVWHHSRAHRFFATARWHPDSVGLRGVAVDRRAPRADRRAADRGRR